MRHYKFLFILMFFFTLIFFTFNGSTVMGFYQRKGWRKNIYTQGNRKVSEIF